MFHYINFREFATIGIIPDNISTSILINIFVYYIIYIFVIISYMISSAVFLFIMVPIGF